MDELGRVVGLRRENGEENKRKTPRQMEQGYYCLQALRRHQRESTSPRLRGPLLQFFPRSTVPPESDIIETPCQMETCPVR
jgi:hypothetical protein